MKAYKPTLIASMLIFLMASATFSLGVGSGSSGGGSTFSGNKEQSASSLYDKGMEYVEEQEYRRAASMFRRAVNIKRDFVEAHNMLGFSFRKMGKYEEAIESYQEALKINPEFAEAHEYIGEAYLAIGEKDLALEHYEVLVSLGSDEADELLEKIEDYERSH